MVAVHY